MSDSPYDVVRRGVRRTVRELLYAEHGTDAIARRQSRVYDLTIDEPADYVQGVAAALKVEQNARGLVREYATKARGEGVSWRDLAKVLDIEIDPEYDDSAETAFKTIAHKPSQPFDRVWTSWTCASCGESITDYGPYEGHPSDDEKGHRADCRRHNAEIAAYRRRNGDDDE
jgi:hypothetical protein